MVRKRGEHFWAEVEQSAVGSFLVLREGTGYKLLTQNRAKSADVVARTPVLPVPSWWSSVFPADPHERRRANLKTWSPSAATHTTKKETVFSSVNYETIAQWHKTLKEHQQGRVYYRPSLCSCFTLTGDRAKAPGKAQKFHLLQTSPSVFY